jgi:hypothetical protein
MDYRAVFASALGIMSPWEVVEIRFSREQHQLDIWVDFPRGSTFACPACGRPGAKVYDTEQKTWRHLTSISTAPIYMPACPGWSAPAAAPCGRSRYPGPDPAASLPCTSRV